MFTNLDREDKLNQLNYWAYFFTKKHYSSLRLKLVITWLNMLATEYFLSSAFVNSKGKLMSPK